MSDEVKLASDYGSGVLSKDTPEERDRLRLLQEWGDPDAHAVFDRIGLAPDWRCLEIGAGAGSIAYGLADRCPEGRVVAVDADARYLSTEGRPHLEIREGDIGAMDFAPGSFDLIHSRLTFCHLAEREEVLARAAGWLAPGGWLAIGDPLCVPAAGSVHAPVRRLFGGLERVWSAQGSDMTLWAQTLPSQLARVGLRDVGVFTRANCLGDDGAYGRLAKANIRQEGAYTAQQGLVDQEDVDAVLALCEDPGFMDVRSLTIYAWGRRPAAT
jgi:SAM-dependent methyltransferase